MSESITLIPLDQIRPHPDNRKEGGFGKDKLEQLAESIRAVGVQQPAIVREVERKMTGGSVVVIFELVAGERRWRAAKLAGLTALPCIVRELDDATALRIQIIENLQRDDVHPLDEAHGFQRLLEAGKYDVESIAKEVGRSASYVYQRLKLQDLVPAARKLLVDGKITAGHAILIARLAPEQQERALNDGLWDYGPDIVPVRDLDDWIHQEILMDLAKVPFAKDDGELLPAVGTCKACQKRTGYQPALFADICKRDYCTDPKCFNAKQDALVARRQKELASEEHLVVTEGYVHKAGLVSHFDWVEIKKSEPGAVRVLVADGPGRGRLTWGKKVDRSEPQGITPEERRDRTRQKNEQKLEKAVEKRLLDTVMERVRTDVTASRRIPTPLLRLVVSTFTGEEIAEDANPSQMLLDLVKSFLSRGLMYGDTSNLSAAAEFYHVDQKKLEQETRESLKAARAEKAKKGGKKHG